jgi:hypothetical protein
MSTGWLILFWLLIAGAILAALNNWAKVFWPRPGRKDLVPGLSLLLCYFAGYVSGSTSDWLALPFLLDPASWMFALGCLYLIYELLRRMIGRSQ